MKFASSVAMLFFAVIAVAHLLRVLFQVEVTAGGRIVPVWMSFVAFLFCGALAILLWLEHRRR
jgi:hypothetical protein